MRLTIDADAEIQVDVLGHEAVLKVLGEARIGRGVRAFRRSPAQSWNERQGLKGRVRG